MEEVEAVEVMAVEAEAAAECAVEAEEGSRFLF
jgi:hypothetical protein